MNRDSIGTTSIKELTKKMHTLVLNQETKVQQD